MYYLWNTSWTSVSNWIPADAACPCSKWDPSLVWSLNTCRVCKFGWSQFCWALPWFHLSLFWCIAVCLSTDEDALHELCAPQHLTSKQLCIISGWSILPWVASLILPWITIPPVFFKLQRNISWWSAPRTPPASGLCHKTIL